MSADSDAQRYDSLLEDDAHLLKSRAVLRIDAEQAPAMQAMLTASLDRLGNGCLFALYVDDAGTIVADAFILRSEGDVLIDCDGEDVSVLRDCLINAGISAEVVTGDWRVFAELPNQATSSNGPPFIRVSDPRRRELGARVYRSSEPAESTAWRHEGLYLAHANRLGVPPRFALLRQFGVDAFEAHFHALGALDPEHVSPDWSAQLRAGHRPQRRVLPFRVEPAGLSLPDMDGAPLLSEGATLGVAMTRQGLWGLGLVELAPWRRALSASAPVLCEGESVLITWPTWIARESEGRASPAAQRIRGVTP